VTSENGNGEAYGVDERSFERSRRVSKAYLGLVLKFMGQTGARYI
jgi:hypothetical protein